MVSYVGLYYPFIHFRDEGWLKMTALYWDSLQRIVPSGAIVHDTDEVKRLVDDGFIQDKRPHKAAHEIALPFRELIGTHGDALSEKYGVAKRDSWPDDAHTRLYAPGRDPKLAYVFHNKMDFLLLSDLSGAGLVVSSGGDRRWSGMHPKLVKVYMVSLAEAMASNLGAHPLTDQVVDHVAISGVTMERLAAALLDMPELAVPSDTDAGTDREVEEAMVSLALRSVAPADPRHIPAEEIVKVRRKFAEERDQFQAEVAQLADSLAYLRDVKDPNEVVLHLQNEYDKTLAPRLKRLQEDLHNVNIDSVESAMAVSLALPAIPMAALIALGLAPESPAAAIAGVALAAWSIQRKRKKAVGAALKPSSEAYLYRVSQLSTPKAVAQKISASSRKFLIKAH